MLFNSLSFVLFFVIVTSLYFLLPHRYRWGLLLLASCVFYMAFVPVYILILGFTIVVDYFAGIYIERAKGRRRLLFLIASLTANIGILAVFKYYNFINKNLTALFHATGVHFSFPYLAILLPIGLSFHTFQAMSYTIEVYRGNQKAVRHFGIYSLYVMFYPQLVAGPIERPQNLLHQFYEKHAFDFEQVKEGLARMLWGFFKKLVIADRLAIFVNLAYGNINQLSGATLILATIFFAFQIYCDFSGYSDIAIGTAQVMGFKLMENFRRPYFSKSIAEFWSRWHISLSTWFRDYLYIPLGGNRVSIPRWYFNLLFVFIVSGLWHGANWTFIVWGAINGVYLIAGIMLAPLGKRLSRFFKTGKYPIIFSFFRMIVTFLLVSFSWIFFRAASLQDAFLIIKKMARFDHLLLIDLQTIIYSLIGISILLASEILKEYFPGKKLFMRSDKAVVRYISYTMLIILILTIGVFDGGQFIYFQF